MSEPQSPSPEMRDAALAVWTLTGKRHEIRIAGSSMLPLLREGDTVLVQHGWANRIAFGGIIVFRTGERLVAHRVLRLRHSAEARDYVTRGDNAPALDPSVALADVVGRVYAIHRGTYEVTLDGPLARILGAMTAGATRAELGILCRTKALGPLWERALRAATRALVGASSWVLWHTRRSQEEGT